MLVDAPFSPLSVQSAITHLTIQGHRVKVPSSCNLREKTTLNDDPTLNLMNDVNRKFLREYCGSADA